MQYKKYILSITLLLLLGGFTGCKKFLEAVPDKGVAVPQELTDLQALLDNTSRMNFQTSPGFAESSSDDYYLPEDIYNSFDESWQKIYTWQREDYNFSNDWSAGYLVIYNANYCLDQVQTIEKTITNTAAWNNVYGSALFFRSYNFLNLLWAYAKAYDAATAASDLGIVLRLNADFNTPSKRASVADCYAQVISDASKAISYLPDLPANVMRPSRAAAYGLLARAYLSMRVYDSAYKYADLGLSLDNELMDYNTDPYITAGADMPFRQFNKEILFYTELTTFDAIYLPVFSSYADTTVYAQFAGGDLRRSIFFKEADGHFQFKGSYSGNYQCFSGVAVDELYLVRAECAARLGKVAAAMADLNLLLKSRWDKDVPFTPYTAATAQEALQTALTERRKELLLRGVRWIDIKRLNKEGADIVLTRKEGGQTFTLPPNDDYYALPLPADVVREAGIEQN